MGVNLSKETVIVQVSERVATVKLNRPATLNALDDQLLTELGETIDQLESDERVDIVVLTGTGKAFSAGGDIKSMLQMENEEQLFEIMDTINNLVLKLHKMPKLTIAALNGATAGLGLSVALATDYIIAHKSAKIAMNFIGIGLIPDGGGHYFLKERIGVNAAKKIIWTGEVNSATTALEIGLIDEIAEGKLDDAVANKVAEWLNKPVLAMIKTKQILAEATRNQLNNIFEQEKVGQAKMRQTADHQEGIKAFIEKRAPNFQGR